MPSSNLAAYLAKNYLTASSAASSDPNEPPKKKRKKTKQQSNNTGLVVADDDEDLNLSSIRNGLNDGEDADVPIMYEGRVHSAEFRKAKKSAWQSLGATEAGATNNGPSDDADAFLRKTQSDEVRRLAEQEAENAPVVVETGDKGAPRMESGLRAGLQTAADTARLVAAEEAREEAERKAARKLRKKKHTDNDGGTAMLVPEEETIYRDATGRRIDISQRRAEARKEEAEKARAKQQEKIDAMGEVQRKEMEGRKKDLEEAKFLTLGRSVEDDEYNERLKDVERWDDPMAAYMAEKRAEEGVARNGGKEKGGKDGQMPTVSRKKAYQGPAPPNRYAIKPGWRWDGVDRGNGFEKEWFQARSKRSRNEALSYEWQMDE